MSFGALFNLGGLGPITLAQTPVKVANGTGASLAATIAAPGAGNTIVCCLANVAAAGGDIDLNNATITVTGGTATRVFNATTANFQAAWYTITGATGTTVTANCPTDSSPTNFHVFEFTHVKLASPTDVTKVASGSSTAPATGSFTPLVDNDVVLVAEITTATATATPAGFTCSETSNTTAFLNSGYQIQTTAAAVSASWTRATSSVWNASGISLKNG